MTVPSPPSPSRLLLLDHWPGHQVTCGSGLGSSLLKLPAAHDAVAAGFEVELLTSPPKAELLEGVAPYKRLYSDPAQVPWTSFQHALPLGVPLPSALPAGPRWALEPRSPQELKADYDLISHVVFWRVQVSAGLGFVPSTKPARLHTEAPTSERAWARERMGPASAVGISLSALTNLKRYRRWRDFAWALHEARPELRLVLLGKEEAPGEWPPRTLDLCTQTSFSQLKGLLAECALVVGTDGLVTNLAGALGRPTLGLFSIIDPEFVFDPTLRRRAPLRALIHEVCPLQPCYPSLGNYRHAICPANPDLDPKEAPQCMEFAPERLVAEALALLK